MKETLGPFQDSNLEISKLIVKCYTVSAVCQLHVTKTKITGLWSGLPRKTMDLEGMGELICNF